MKCPFCDSEEIIYTEEVTHQNWWVWNFVFLMIFFIFFALATSMVLTLNYTPTTMPGTPKPKTIPYLEIGILGMCLTCIISIIYNIIGFIITMKNKKSNTKAVCLNCHNGWYIFN